MPELEIWQLRLKGCTLERTCVCLHVCLRNAHMLMGACQCCWCASPALPGRVSWPCMWCAVHPPCWPSGSSMWSPRPSGTQSQHPWTGRAAVLSSPGSWPHLQHAGPVTAHNTKHVCVFNLKVYSYKVRGLGLCACALQDFCI